MIASASNCKLVISQLSFPKGREAKWRIGCCSTDYAILKLFLRADGALARATFGKEECYHFPVVDVSFVFSKTSPKPRLPYGKLRSRRDSQDMAGIAVRCLAGSL